MALRSNLRRARRAGWRCFKALLVLGLIPVAMGTIELVTRHYFTPLDLNELRNVGEEICIQAEAGTLRNIQMGARLHTATALGPGTAGALREMSLHLAQGCRVMAESPVPLFGPGFPLTFIKLVDINATTALSIGINIVVGRGPFLGYFLNRYETGGDPYDRAQFRFCCYGG